MMVGCRVEKIFYWIPLTLVSLTSASRSEAREKLDKISANSVVKRSSDLQIQRRSSFLFDKKLMS